MSPAKNVGARVTGAISWIGNSAGVGLLWVAFALPVLTVFASTAALLTVLRRWLDGDDPPVIAKFREAFGVNLRRALIIQLLWMVVLALAWTYLQFAAGTPDDTIRVIVLAITLLLLLVGGGTAVFVLPILVDHPGTVRQVLRNSALLAAANPGHTLLGMLLVLVTVTGCLLIIPLAPVTGVAGTSLVYRICRRAIRRTTDRAAQNPNLSKDASTTSPPLT